MSSAHLETDDARAKRLLRDAVAEKALQHTVQIQYQETGEPQALGSGVLLELGNSIFLLSAAHVFKNASGRGALAATGGRGVADVIDLRKRRWIMMPDPYDVCALELSRADVSAWKKLRPIHLGDLGVGDDQHPDNWYFMLGFPVRAFSPDPDSKLVHSQGYVYASHASTNQAVIDRLDGSINISIEWYPDANEGDWYPDRLCSLQGVSGGGIWRVPRKKVPHTLADLKPDLIGIAMGAFEEHKVFVGTRIEHLVGMIHKEYPTLRPALDLVLPRSMRAS